MLSSRCRSILNDVGDQVGHSQRSRVDFYRTRLPSVIWIDNFHTIRSYTFTEYELQIIVFLMYIFTTEIDVEKYFISVSIFLQSSSRTVLECQQCDSVYSVTSCTAWLCLRRDSLLCESVYSMKVSTLWMSTVWQCLRCESVHSVIVPTAWPSTVFSVYSVSVYIVTVCTAW